VVVDLLPAPEPLLSVAIRAKSKGDEDKLANALHRLQEEDPVLRIERNAETHQTVLRGMGETHLSIATEKLARKFGVEVETDDVKVTCFEGKHHPVDSSEMAFKTAAAMGLRDALAKAGPVLLEPVSELVVVVPEVSQGDIMGDLNGKRGRIQGSASLGSGEVEITAHVPTS